MKPIGDQLTRLRQRWTGRHELALFALGYLVYFGVRAVTQGDRIEAVENARRVVDLERALDLDWERTLQTVVIGSHALVDAANAVYIWGHWPVLLIGGVLLYHHAPVHYFRLRNVCLLSGALGFAIFALFPLAPPRLAGFGLVDTVTAAAGTYRTVLPAAIVNEYAAMPSFHAGWNLLLGIALFQASRHLLVRGFALLMPAAMAFAVVVTANHYIVDVVAGCAIVLASLLIVDRVHEGVSRPPTLDRHAKSPIPGRTPCRERPAGVAARRAVADPAGRS